MSRGRRYIVLIPLLLFLYLVSIPFAFSWGFHAHKKINHEAVYALPATLQAFYKKNIDYITNHAVDPDNHKYTDSLEASRHFIDVDHYGIKAFDEMPKYWKVALEKYHKDTLQKYGTLPYEVLFWLEKLTDAFKSKDGNEILRASAYMGHYIADAHVPLHTISNYDGQKTEQEGIHALWETAIPEAYSGKYIFSKDKATYIKDPEAKIWEIIKQSYLLAPTVLSTEKQVSLNFTDDKKYMKSKKTNDKKQFSSEYVAAYNKALNGMVAKQMQSSILDVAAFWYTAWVNAASPIWATSNNVLMLSVGLACSVIIKFQIPHFAPLIRNDNVRSHLFRSWSEVDPAPKPFHFNFTSVMSNAVRHLIISFPLAKANGNSKPSLNKVSEF